VLCFKFCGYLFGCFSHEQSFRLCEEIRHQLVVVVRISVQGLFKSNEIRGNQFGALVDQLEKGMLRVGARFAPNDGARLIIDWLTIATHAFSVAFHDALLQVRSQFL